MYIYNTKNSPNCKQKIGGEYMISDWFEKVRKIPILDVISYLKLRSPFTSNGKDKIRSNCILPNHAGKNKNGSVNNAAVF